MPAFKSLRHIPNFQSRNYISRKPPGRRTRQLPGVPVARRRELYRRARTSDCCVMVVLTEDEHLPAASVTEELINNFQLKVEHLTAAGLRGIKG